ncbi:TPA: energy transducer TonB [Klebsiella variicola subsp. variicola]|uniref:energy transducer TonB n=1 Tax=Klebsiella variicola TaxID=244366 RepID=UPI0012590F7F|nr:energy transducer TonB [Klebsiella variicola]MCX2362007.1 energy transducer TonB [Klebsiella variicola]VAT76791.1 transport protein TonB [Klebsiella variicola]HDK6468934.1 energy transducer TonB [Klebsiella variicola]HDZ0569292.1 energy transducer TonB [Klebsiella quasipneumoniae]
MKTVIGEHLPQPLAYVAVSSTVNGDAPRREYSRLALALLATITLHAAMVAWLVTQTTEYTPLNLVTPQESASIQASLIEYSEPPQAPAPAVPTPVLTADRGEREVAKTDSKPQQPERRIAPAKPASPAPQPTVKKARPVKPAPPRPPAPAAVNTPSPGPTPSHGQSQTAAAGADSGRMMQSNSSAQPKNVSAIGCAVPQPDYPRRARRLKQEGEVLVRLVVNPQGELTRYEIARSSGVEALDQAALAAVQKTRCSPYVENGRAIAVMTLQPVNFRLAR